MQKQKKSWLNEKSDMIQEDRLVWADAIRVVAIYLIILIHVASVVVIPWEHAFTLAWWGAHWLRSLAVVAVPWLVLLSGSLLLPKHESATKFYTKRMQKVVVPWLFWVSILFFVDLWVWKKVDPTSMTVISLVGAYMRTGYWLMPVLLQLYAVTPVLRKWVGTIAPRVGITVALTWQLLVAAQYTWCSYTSACQAWDLPLGLAYVGYYVLGYYLAETIYSAKKLAVISLPLFIGAMLSLVYGTVTLSIQQHGFNASIYQFISLPVFIMSGVSFIAAKQFFQHASFAQYRQWIADMSKQGFSVFFVHGFILELLTAKVAFFRATLLIGAGSFVVIWTTLIFVASYGIVLCLRKVPLLQRVI